MGNYVLNYDNCKKNKRLRIKLPITSPAKLPVTYYYPSNCTLQNKYEQTEII